MQGVYVAFRSFAAGLAVQGIQGLAGSNNIACPFFVILGSDCVFGIGCGDPADKGVTLRDVGCAGQGDDTAGISFQLIGCGSAVFQQGDAQQFLFLEDDFHGAVGLGVDHEDVAVPGHSGSTGSNLDFRYIICGSGSDSQILAHQAVGTHSCIGLGDGDLIVTGVQLPGFAGGSGVIGDLGTEQHEGQLGIVNKHVAGAGDGLNGVVAAQLPGVHGVGLHPLQQHFTAFHDTAGAPHFAGIAPTDIHIQHDAGNVTAQIIRAVGNLVGVVVTGAFAVGSVTAAAVLTFCGGTQHHNVVFGVALALAVGPGVFTVPGVTTIPFGADGGTGIEGGDSTVRGIVSVLTIGILVQIPGFVIAGNMAVLRLHKSLQSLVQLAVGHFRSGGRAFHGREVFICILSGIESLCVAGQGMGSFFPLAPVGNVACCRYRSKQSGSHADDQHKHQNQRQPTFHELLHNS